MAMLALALPTFLPSQEEPLARRILKWSEADQIAWLEAHFADGMPPGPIDMLVLNKSSIALPVLESRIEEVLKSASPRAFFTNPSADPKKAVEIAASLIAYAGDEQALRELSKLIKIDEGRFGDLVSYALSAAMNRHKAFQVAYKGFEIGDPAIDKRIVAWVENLLRNKKESIRNVILEPWAEAIVEKYDGAPTTAQWTTDPIASRLDPAEHASVYLDMRPFAAVAEQKRKKK